MQDMTLFVAIVTTIMVSIFCLLTVFAFLWKNKQVMTIIW